MRRLLFLVLPGLLFAANLQAFSPNTDKQQSTDKGEAQTTKPAANNRQSGKPAPTFTPTEKIGADSAVSFPVDI